MPTIGIDRLQLSHRRAIQRRYDDDQRRMALAIALLLYQFSRNGSLPTDMQSRLMLKGLIWAHVLRLYYIGPYTEPFTGPDPQSPFATLVRDGVEGAMRIQVKRSIAMLKRYIKDETILRWFLAPTFRPVELPVVRQENYQAPFYAYVDPNGYKLNDRILRNAIDARAKLDRMLDFHILNGMDAGTLGGTVANFMTISGRATRQSYGDYGSYAPWKMLRSEMQVANGRATVIAAELNPVVDRIWWRLSTVHHIIDVCDNNASGGPNGDGIYDKGDVPDYPNHANEMCSLVLVVDRNHAHMQNLIEHYIRTHNDIALRWRGTMDEDSLIRSLMTEQYRADNPLTGQNLRGVPAVRLAPRR